MYKIIGANQAEYGPVSADQVRQWIAEGRINAQTQAQAVGDTGWKPISMFTEFAASFPSPNAPPPPMSGPAPISPFSSASAGRPGALNEVTGPAIGLMVVGILGVFIGVSRIIMDVLGVSFANLNGMQGMQGFGGQSAQMMQLMQTLSGTVGIVFAVIQIILGVFVFFGGLKMKSLEMHTLCIVASIIAIIPCVSPCCCVGIPFGIWALVVLNKASVRDFFS